MWRDIAECGSSSSRRVAKKVMYIRRGALVRLKPASITSGGNKIATIAGSNGNGAEYVLLLLSAELLFPH